MQASIDWFRKECSSVEARASGRVTPALLSSVRVRLPDSNTDMRLEEVATVGVREGSTLIITIFEEDVRFYHR
jgi:ribosome recycling factor